MARMACGTHQMPAPPSPAWPPAYHGAYSMAWRNRHRQQLYPRQHTLPCSPHLPQRINQQLHMYHPSEVEEDKATERVDKEEAMADDGDKIVSTITQVRRMGQHPQQPEEYSRQAKQWPLAKRITTSASTTRTCVSVAASIFPSSTLARHAPSYAVRMGIKKDAIAKIIHSMQRRGIKWLWKERTRVFCPPIYRRIRRDG